MKPQQRVISFIPLLLVLSLLLAACPAPQAPAAPAAEAGADAGATAAMQAIGEGEGAVSIVAWAGYIERGETDPAYDWVTEFEAETGCTVSVKVAATSDEMVSLMNEPRSSPMLPSVIKG